MLYLFLGILLLVSNIEPALESVETLNRVSMLTAEEIRIALIPFLLLWIGFWLIMIGAFGYRPLRRLFRNDLFKKQKNAEEVDFKVAKKAFLVTLALSITYFAIGLSYEYTEYPLSSWDRFHSKAYIVVMFSIIFMGVSILIKELTKPYYLPPPDKTGEKRSDKNDA